MTFPPTPPWALACRWCHAIRHTLRGALICPHCDWTPAPRETTR